MSKENESSNTIDDQDYDELDDLLDEDPTKLEEPQESNSTKESKSTTDNAGSTGEDMKEKEDSSEDPEVKQMISELEKEFGKLMDQDGSNSDGNSSGEAKQQQESFKQILEMLGEASKDAQNGTANSAGSSHSKDSNGPDGFKDVVSKTLERLKENGPKVDHNIAQEQGQQDVLTQMLSELANGNPESGGAGEDGVDDAILAMLNQMSSKQVLYEPMREMHTEFAKWLDANGSKTKKEDLDKYHRQFGLVAHIVQVFEKPTYRDDHDRQEITQLLDQLEQLGDTPVSKAQNDQNQADFGELDQELAQNCKQQ